MKHRIYELIKQQPLSYNSPSLGEIFNITPDEIRTLIREICEETDVFEFGIISINHKYKLATDGEDFEMKVKEYRSKHNLARKGEALWLKRQGMVDGTRRAIPREAIENVWLEEKPKVVEKTYIGEDASPSSCECEKPLSHPLREYECMTCRKEIKND